MPSPWHASQLLKLLAAGSSFSRLKLSKMRLPRVATNRCILLVCDIQESFRGRAVGMPLVISTAKLMLDSTAILGIPSIVSEQYPKGLGSTVPELEINMSQCMVPTFEKDQVSLSHSPMMTWFVSEFWHKDRISSLVLNGYGRCWSLTARAPKPRTRRGALVRPRGTRVRAAVMLWTIGGT